MKRMILIVALAAAGSIHAQNIRMNALQFAESVAAYEKVSPAVASVPEPVQTFNAPSTGQMIAPAVPVENIAKKDFDVNSADIVVQEDLIAGRKADDMHLNHFFSGFINKIKNLHEFIFESHRK